MNAFSCQDFAFAFLSILLEGIPFILIGTLISGCIEVYLPSQALDRFLPRNRFLAIFCAAFLGIFLPVCECAVVPVIRRLIQKGLPVSCGITYMLAAPIINPITAFSTWKAFQGQFPLTLTCSRLSLAALVALTVGLISSFLKPSNILKKYLIAPSKPTLDGFLAPTAITTNPPTSTPQRNANSTTPTEASPDAKLTSAMRCALHDFADVATLFVCGVALTALLNTAALPGIATLDAMAKNPTLAPFSLMVMAFVLSLCSTSDAFIAATLDRFSWAAKLAFLVLGPMLDLKLLFLYQSFMRRKFLLGLCFFLFASIYLLSQLCLWLIHPL